MKLTGFILSILISQISIFATGNCIHPDSVKSFILSKKNLRGDQKSGEIAQSFWKVELKTMDGKTLTMDSFKGKYIYLNFWGEWCPGCREEMPSIVEAYKKFKDKVEFIGLLKPHNITLAQKFINEQKMEFPQVILLKEFKKKFNFDGFPLSILILPDGRNYIRADEVDKKFFERNIK